MAKATKKPRGAKKQTEPEMFGLILNACRVITFNIDFPSEDPTGKELFYQISLLPGPMPDPATAPFVLDVNGFLPGGQPDASPEKAFTLKILSVFQYTGLDSLEKDADGDVVVPEWLNATIVSILIGSARGILMEKLASTIYKDEILPIIGMNSLGPGIVIPSAMQHGV